MLTSGTFVVVVGQISFISSSVPPKALITCSIASSCERDDFGTICDDRNGIFPRGREIKWPDCPGNREIKNCLVLLPAGKSVSRKSLHNTTIEKCISRMSQIFNRRTYIIKSK